VVLANYTIEVETTLIKEQKERKEENKKWYTETSKKSRGKKANLEQA